MVFGEVINFIDKVTEESKKDSEYINIGKAKMFSINWDVVINGYKKAQYILKNQEKQKENIAKELEAKYNNIQKIRDENKLE